MKKSKKIFLRIKIIRNIIMKTNIKNSLSKLFSKGISSNIVLVSPRKTDKNGIIKPIPKSSNKPLKE